MALALSPDGFAPWNTEISVTMLFGGLKADSDRDTTDYVFRADVVDADACEGGGLGIDRYMYQVDQDPETRSGTIAAGCPIGGYTIEASIATEADGVVASASAEFSIFGPSIGLAIPVTEQGAGGVLTLSFGFLAPDADADTTDYIFRADVVDADACEGDGLGVDRHIHQVDEDPETHTGTISADCPAGDYTLEASISSPDGVELASASASFTIAPPVEDDDDPPVSRQQQAMPQDFFLDSDNSSPGGIWSDGTTMWVTDSDENNKLYAYALADGTRQDGTGSTTNREFALHADNGYPTGIWSDGTTMWVTDGSDYKLYAYALADGTRQDGTDGTTSKEFALHSDNGNPLGIWSNGSTIWVADYGDDKLYAYALADGTRQDGTGGTTSKEFALHADNGIPTGIWSDGATIWVADSDDVKLYAYALADGIRQDGGGGTANREFALHSDNSAAFSIWSDGTTMWVNEISDGKVYTYAMPTPVLTGLTVSPGTLDPAFNSDTLEYAVSDVPHASGRITVTATAESGADVSYEDGSGNTLTDVDSGTTGDQFDLVVGENVIEVKVTKGSLSRTYALAVSREAAVPTSFDLHPDNSNARGIWSDGTTMWVADSAYFEGRPYSEERASKLYAYALADGTRQDGTGGTVNKEFDLDSNSIYPIGIWSDYRTMWVGDYYGGRVYAYALGDGTRQDGIANEDKDKEIDPGPHADNGAVSGIWSNGVTMWVADPDDDKIYAYSLADGRRQDGAPHAYVIDGIRYRFDGRLYDENAVNEEFDLHRDNASPIGISSIDETILVLDDEDARLYAYARADGTRQDGTGGADDWEFDLNDDNGNPVGIWSSNEKMWVLDGDDGKVYSYTFPIPPMLTGLSVSPGTLTPAFDSKTRDYAVPDVPHASDRITVTATAEGRARVSYEDGSGNSLTDADADAAGDQFDLEVGENVIRIRVTEGEVSRTYALAVSRAYHPSLSPPYRFTWSDGVHYHNCQLGPENNPYWEFSVSTDSSATRLVQPSDLRRSGHDDCSATVRIPLSYFPLGSCDLNADNLCITVRHTELFVDHNTGRYTASVSRPVVVELIPASTDATLRALALSGVDFGAFASTTTEYAASVAHAVAETTVTPAVSDYRAAYAVKLGGVVDADGTVPLAEGENVIAVKVTAEDGETAQTYSVTVTRAAPLAAPGRPTGVVPEPGKVTLDWDDVDGATGYQVGLWSQPNLVLVPSDAMPGVTVQMNGSSATLTGLPAEWSHYWLRVRASNDGGASGWSDWLTLENQ